MTSEPDNNKCIYACVYVRGKAKSAAGAKREQSARLKYSIK